jgi:hypothetical protein
MRHSPSPHWAGQLKLFHPAIKSPRWDQLPREIRQQSVRLLARLLREHWARKQAAEALGEAGDE